MAITANVADSAVLPALLHGNETCGWEEQACRRQTAVIRRHAPNARNFMKRRLRQNGIGEPERARKRNQSRVCATVEHRFTVITLKFGFIKLRDKSLDKGLERAWTRMRSARSSAIRRPSCSLPDDPCRSFSMHSPSADGRDSKRHGSIPAEYASHHLFTYAEEMRFSPRRARSTRPATGNRRRLRRAHRRPLRRWLWPRQGRPRCL